MHRLVNGKVSSFRPIQDTKMEFGQDDYGFSLKDSDYKSLFSQLNEKLSRVNEHRLINEMTIECNDKNNHAIQGLIDFCKSGERLPFKRLKLKLPFKFNNHELLERLLLELSERQLPVITLSMAKYGYQSLPQEEAFKKLVDKIKKTTKLP